MQSHQSFGLFYFKAGCLLFWAGWFSLAAATNLFDYLYALGLMPNYWLFKSGNYALLAQTLQIYLPSKTLLNALFVCDITTQCLSALLFWCAFGVYFFTRSAYKLINSAFMLSMALWAVFIIMEEIFIAYKFEGVHSELFIFELMTLLAIHFLPDRKQE